jgi:hypothetical protein
VPSMRAIVSQGRNTMKGLRRHTNMAAKDTLHVY